MATISSYQCPPLVPPTNASLSRILSLLILTLTLIQLSLSLTLYHILLSLVLLIFQILVIFSLNLLYFPPSSQPPFLSNRKPPLLQHPPVFAPLLTRSLVPLPHPPSNFLPFLPIYSTHPPLIQLFNPPPPVPYPPHHVQHPSNSLNSALLNLLTLLIPQVSLLPNLAGQTH